MTKYLQHLCLDSQNDGIYSDSVDYDESFWLGQFDGNDTRSNESLEVENFQISNDLVSLKTLAIQKYILHLSLEESVLLEHHRGPLSGTSFHILVLD